MLPPSPGDGVRGNHGRSGAAARSPRPHARVVTTATAGSPLARLTELVTGARQQDVLSSVTVLVPNNLAGITARRHLARGVAGRPGIANVEVVTLARLAERLVAHRMGGRRPLTTTVLTTAWRRQLADDPGIFGDIADHPATANALVRAHRELRDLTPEALDSVATTGPVTAQLVRMHRAVVGALAASFYDETDLLLAAAATWPRLGRVIDHLPQQRTRAERRFVDAVAECSEASTVAGLTGIERLDRAIIPSDLIPLALSTPTASAVHTCSDADDEIRAVLRDLIPRLGTTPAHRVGVFYSASQPYARLLHEQLAAARIRTNGPGVRAVDERATSRAFLGLLALADRGIPRADLFRALADAPVRTFDGQPVPLVTWERLSRSAGVVAGGDWEVRLDQFLADRQTTIDLEKESDDPDSGRAEAARRDVEAANGLRTFVTTLRKELARAGGLTSWTELADWCRSLFDTLLGGATHLPSEEQYAVVALRSQLDQLAGLDDVGTAADLGLARQLLSAGLAASLPRVGTFGEGVFVGPIAASVGLDLDIVYTVGLSEDQFPARLGSDGLLPDESRAASLSQLRPRRDRFDADHRHLLNAWSAPTSVATFPRGDLRRSTRRLPSRFLLPTLRALADDALLAATEWERLPEGSGVTSTPSFAAGLLGTAMPATEQEWRTRAVFAGAFTDDAVQAATSMIAERAGTRFTRYDGNLSGQRGLPEYIGDSTVVSPTTLEQYATCPHAYFVQRLLGVRPLEQPEDIVVISALEIGNLIHESLDQLVKDNADSLPGPGARWSETQRQQLQEIGRAQADEAQRRGLTGHPRLWEPERLRILDDLAHLMDDDDARRARNAAAVVASELTFGMGDQPPVRIPVDGGTVLMRGSADRVDRAADGRLHVLDLKTGSTRSYQGISADDPTAGGTKLQLPVYAHAARHHLGTSATPVTAAYWFVRKERGKLIELPLTTEVEREHGRVIGVLARSVAGGLFPARAPETDDFAFVQCWFCNPDGIGHREVRARWETKRSDPALSALTALIDPEDEAP